ncbi:hypothetical protein GCM10009740_20460 [Terrabacter terrae]|uniref:Uncharacterized protein n=1 Tax=Terrabacter terrae TaxID=318434 RepID=A0ABP5FQW4_9MICO
MVVRPWSVTSGESTPPALPAEVALVLDDLLWMSLCASLITGSFEESRIQPVAVGARRGREDHLPGYVPVSGRLASFGGAQGVSRT